MHASRFPSPVSDIMACRMSQYSVTCFYLCIADVWYLMFDSKLAHFASVSHVVICGLVIGNVLPLIGLKIRALVFE